MTARFFVGDEHYLITHGEVTPDAQYYEDEADRLVVARAQYLTIIGPMWVSEAVHDGTLSSYDPDPDCTLATIISQHLSGTPRCEPPAPIRPNVRY